MTGPDPKVLRANILELLELLADAGGQAKYERDVPIADVPAELVCSWFDDQYLPDSPWFRAAFSAAELETLAAFDRSYGVRVNALRSGGGVAALHRSRVWAEIMAEAAAVRARLQ